ncbi:TIGR04255 family protein [Burkholderia vietnamiensis]|uniref:TIGR04255 family protein n=1 Tax=Burkholderia vietnamiensis TaxID=60552 RepID=UPI0009BF70CA|nr:TIGR04255 family protein [Burkholderia vietnamiensis]
MRSHADPFRLPFRSAPQSNAVLRDTVLYFPVKACRKLRITSRQRGLSGKVVLAWRESQPGATSVSRITIVPSPDMAEIRHLANAPIREAIIDIQFVPDVAIEAVDSFAANFASANDRVSDLWSSTLELQVESTGVRQSQVGARVGKRIDLYDGKHIVQLRTSGFTFSRLPPYERWEVMSEHALGIWQKYLEAMKPTGISRLATRFINSIEIALPITDFGDFLEYPPEVPDSLPQGVMSFINRVTFAAPSADFTTVTQMLEGMSPDQKSVTILLDIDAAHSAPTPITDLLQAAPILNRLRDTKNKAFFGFLKDKALEPYL